MGIGACSAIMAEVEDRAARAEFIVKREAAMSEKEEFVRAKLE